MNSSQSTSSKNFWTWRILRHQNTLAVWLVSLCLFFVGCSEPEIYNPLVDISNATLTRPAPEELRISLDYELAPEERLPLPYREIVVSPLEPQAKIFAPLDCSHNQQANAAQIISGW